MFGHWQRELERSEWRGRVDRTLIDIQTQVAETEKSIDHLHKCMESRLTPLLAWQNRILGIVAFLTIAMPLIIWALGSWGKRP